MSKLHRDPSPRELLERIARLERTTTRAEESATRLQKDVDRLTAYLDRLFQTRANEMADVIDRLSILEGKIFPSMGPMLDGIQKIVGKFSEWKLNNPLDRRKKETS